jgi:hypothetical protein
VFIPKSVRVIAEHCIEGCFELSQVGFQPPSTMHAIKHCDLTGLLFDPAIVNRLVRENGVIYLP